MTEKPPHVYIHDLPEYDLAHSFEGWWHRDEGANGPGHGKYVPEDQWQPISTAPIDGTKFLGWVNDDWIEGFRIENGVTFYTNDGDGPTLDVHDPKYWKPWPISPEDQ